MNISSKKFGNIREWFDPEMSYANFLKHLYFTEVDTQISVLPYLFGSERTISMMDFSGAWRKDLRKDQFFQFWNRDFNNEIARVIDRVTNEVKPRLILDVCAGNGMLAKILTRRGFNVVAVDSYEWPFEKHHYKVEKMDYSKGLETYNPDFVIGCWMPLGTNWTPLFRTHLSVKNYMIIGEGEGGCCGGDWEEYRGWKAQYHERASDFALCRTDYFNVDKLGNINTRLFGYHHSQVYTFSRS